MAHARAEFARSAQYHADAVQVARPVMGSLVVRDRLEDGRFMKLSALT